MDQGFRGSGRSELERLMEQYGSSLLRMCALYLKDADLAQDAVQETFIRAYRHIEDYRGESSERTWLTAIAINVSRDMLRTAWFRHQSRSTVPGNTVRSVLYGPGGGDDLSADRKLRHGRG